MSHRRWPLVTGIIVALLVVAGIATYLFTAGPLARTTVPSLEGVTTAKDAEAQLKSAGIATVHRQEFSRQQAGAFLGLDGVEPGQPVNKDDEVTIIESLGPGVPEGTVGTTQDAAVERVKDMGVGVRVVSVASGKTAGTVIDSSPADGKAVEKDGAITLAVASTEQGIPMEIAGEDLDKATSELEDAGFSVTTQARVASKDNIGKVVGADPSIGTVTDAGNVTLYYGVDAQGVKESMQTDASQFGSGSAKALDNVSAFVGTWCNDAGDCHTLEPAHESQWNQSDGSTALTHYQLKLDGADHGDGYWDYLTAIPYGQDILSALDSPQNTSAKYLLNRGTSGAVELFAANPYPYCGDTVMGGVGNYCANGQVRSGSGESAGTVYRMNDFVLAMPVGADLDALEQQGYFAQKSDAKPDGTRPYILVRDPSLYDESDRTSNADGVDENPFIPGRTSGPAPFRPAAGKDTAYYYVEEAVDWKTLGDGEEICPDDGCTDGDGKDSSTSENDSDKVDGDRTVTESSPKTTDGMSIAEIRTELSSGDFAIIAGKYCTRQQQCFTMDDHGTISPGENLEYKFTVDGGSTTMSVPDQPSFTTDEVSVELSAPDDDYYCGGERGLACKSKLAEYSSAEVASPVHLAYYPKGVKLDAGTLPGPLMSGQQLPQTDREFIQLLWKSHNMAPTDDSVYYKQ